MTQIKIVGYIGISELVVFAVAPFIFFKSYGRLRANGFIPVINLALTWLVSAILSDWINGSKINDLLKGVAHPYAVLSWIVVIHYLADKYIYNLKWLLLGVAVSSIICIFIFQPGSAVSVGGYEVESKEAMERVLGYKLFWVTRLSLWLPLAIQMAYLRTPTILSLGIAGFLAVFSLLEGGRSAFLAGAVGFAILLVGGKNIARMKLIKKYFVLALVGGVIVLTMVNASYRYAVKSGKLGEEELSKYEKQTSSGEGALNLLMAGRGDFFIGLIAVIDKPLLGHGSWALDTNGYQEEFYSRYGSESDLNRYYRRLQHGVRTIPGHSHIISFWLWHGIAGGVFWIYIFVLILKTLKSNMALVPEWYGYFGLAIPSLVWAILFSPFGMRTTVCCLIVACLFVNAIAKGRYRYVPEVIINKGKR